MTTFSLIFLYLQGDICLSHKQLEVELSDSQEKVCNFCYVNIQDVMQTEIDLCPQSLYWFILIPIYILRLQLENCSSELIECEKNLNFTSDVILKSTELLKL